MATRYTHSLSEHEIRSVVGRTTYDRGATYARQGRVERLTGHERSGLLGEVRGGGRHVYATLVTLGDSRAGASWSARCSCPVGQDCKHAVAVLLASRADGAIGDDGTASPAASAWEDPLAPLATAVAHAGAAAPGTPLALELVIVTPPTPARSGARQGPARGPVDGPGRSPTRRVLLRPLTMGARGRWVRSGASWQELRYGYSSYGRRGPVPEHRDTLLELDALAAARRQTYQRGDIPVHLDDVGPAVWQALARVVDAGVELLTTGGGDGGARHAAAHLLDRPAAVTLDLRRTGDGDARLASLVELDGASLPSRDVDLVGSPAHGVIQVGGADGSPAMRLGPLERTVGPELAALLGHPEETVVPAAQQDRFMRTYYPALQRVATVSSSDGSVALPQVHPPLLSLLVAYGADHTVSLGWRFSYQVDDAVHRVPTVGPASSPGALRDRVAERALLAEAARADTSCLGRPDAPVPAPTDADVILTGLATARFTSDVLPGLHEPAWLDLVVTGEPAPYRDVADAPLVRLSTTQPDGRNDWFDLGIEVSVAGEPVPFEPLFVALASGQTHLLLDSGAVVAIDRPELQQLRLLIEEARALTDPRSRGLRISPLQVDLWQELVSLGVVQEQSERWRRAVVAVDSLRAPAPVPAPAGLTARLRPYQHDGYQWLTMRHQAGLGGVLADDMGLGKTVQALAMVCRAVEQDPTLPPVLVVAPTSVVAAWAQEAARFVPDLRVAAVTRTVAKSGRPIAEQAAGAHVVVTSYTLFRLDYDHYADLPWDALLLDEAQQVKNHRGRTHQCVRRLPARVKFAVTGTPMENNLMELWALLSIVAPGLYPDPQRFDEHVARPVASGEHPERLATLRRRLLPFVLRRTKEQVATDLPAKVEQVLEVDLQPRHRRIYQTHLQRERQKVLRLIDDPQRNRFEILRSLTLLRRLSLDPALVDDTYAGAPASKVDVLMERLGEVVTEGHRALVFSQFTGFLRTVRQRLDAAGVPYVYLDGRTRDREKRVAAWRRDGAPVFLISLKAGGVGLTLTEADYCFVLDPWWNPAVEAQAVDRTHRIGQDKTVMVYRLVARDTVEEKVMALKARKLALTSSVLAEDGGPTGALDEADIRGLLDM